MASISEIKEVILAASASVSMLSVAIGIFIAIGQYRLKREGEKQLAESKRAEEKRLSLSTQADVDIQLFKSFTDLMDLATGRRQHVLSEKAIEELFKLKLISKNDFNENFTIRQKGSDKFSEYAVVVLPVGKSAQNAAIAGISTLAMDYPVLMTAAIEGLKSMETNEIAQKYLQILEDHKSKSALEVIE